MDKNAFYMYIYANLARGGTMTEPRYGYYFDDRRRKSLPCALLAAFNVSNTHTGRSGKIQHPCWVLDYSIRPAGKCKVGRGEWTERGANVAHLYPPEISYWEDTTTACPPIHGLYILFSGGESLDLLRFIKNRSGYARFLDPEKLLKIELFRTASECHSKGKNGFWSAQSHLFSIVDLLHHAACPVGEPGVFSLAVADNEWTSHKSLSERVISYLRSNIEKPLTLAAIAQYAGVSVSTLSHKYPAETGESPLRTLVKLRINLAKGLLMKGECLKAIANMTGFYDEFHLSKTFKLLTGCSPRAFLQEQHAKERLSKGQYH